MLLFATARLHGQTPPEQPDNVAKNALKFTSVYDAIEQNYVDPVDTDHAIFDGGIRGMLSSLDPFCAFLDRDQFESLKQQTRGEAVGFGSILYVSVGKILVLQTTPNSPSARAGLGPGDEIVEVNGQRVARLDFQSLVELLQRSRSHPVALGVIHAGHFVPQDISLRPAEVAMPSVDKHYLWSAGIAYAHISSFEGKTAAEVAEALDAMNPALLKGLLLDLRDNHGGLVDSAAAVASLFLKEGDLILTTRGRSMKEQAYRVPKMPAHYDMRVVILVNGDTASAAEVLAAALQEHGRAVVAGVPTFGKGVVQQVESLSEGTALAITAGQYFTPSGRSIQRPIPGTALTFASLSSSADEIEHSPPTHGKVHASTSVAKFHTDDGRPLKVGGGVTPDVEIKTEADDPWLAFVKQRGYLTSYAESYLAVHSRPAESAEVTTAMLEDLKQSLLQNGVRVPDEYWNKDQDALKLLLKVEFTSLSSGLEKGEEFATRSDPQVQRAAQLLAQTGKILAKK